MDWSELLPELLDAILGKLTEFTDNLCFRSVCHSWQNIAKSHGMPPSIPWLYLPQNPVATNLQFYSFSENKVYKIPFPEAQDSQIIGSASGFLLIVGCLKNPKVLMINPFTGTKAHLPYVGHYDQYIQWDYSGSIVVTNYGCLKAKGGVYCRPGDHSWSGIDALADCLIHRIVHKAGSFYVLDYRTPVFYVLDDKMPNLTRIIRIPQYDPKYCQLFVFPDAILLSTHYYRNELPTLMPNSFDPMKQLS
ncbi:hypothetical protein LUZ63_012417 [Rhynchospora breviuscula]|uniref:KIB1-4 beta-propeller domain-containing protein n=1 Tax=Rhynchospora breviuscula TaxID=2022672 RepID=A0A9Q0CLN2_9POAL|nr:hypothetical protein LUZ63_012417 [Rhynchospora breviuscula]